MLRITGQRIECRGKNGGASRHFAERWLLLQMIQQFVQYSIDRAQSFRSSSVRVGGESQFTGRSFERSDDLGRGGRAYAEFRLVLAVGQPAPAAVVQRVHESAHFDPGARLARF